MNVITKMNTDVNIDASAIHPLIALYFFEYFDALNAMINIKIENTSETVFKIPSLKIKNTKVFKMEQINAILAKLE